jgi:hypothetical protein
MRVGFFLEGMKARAGEGGGRILLGDNTVGGLIMLGRSGSTLLELGF